jgi:hypothetical protein
MGMHTVPPYWVAEVDASAEPLSAVLVGIASGLEHESDPLRSELTELIRLSDGDLTAVQSLASFELMSEPVTSAEEVASEFLTAVAIYARDAALDDAAFRRLMRLATVCAARFDSYLAERNAY